MWLVTQMASCISLLFDNNCIVVCRADDGSFIRKFGSSGTADGQFHGCHGVAVNGKGLVIVTDQQEPSCANIY